MDNETVSDADVRDFLAAAGPIVAELWRAHGHGYHKEVPSTGCPGCLLDGRLER